MGKRNKDQDPMERMAGGRGSDGFRPRIPKDLASAEEAERRAKQAREDAARRTAERRREG